MINLARLKERVERCTGKEWIVANNKVDVHTTDATFTEVCMTFRFRDANFIAHARTDIPKLIEAIEILSAACESIAQSEYTFGERTDFTEEAYEAQEALELAAKKLESWDENTR